MSIVMDMVYELKADEMDKTMVSSKFVRIFKQRQRERMEQQYLDLVNTFRKRAIQINTRELERQYEQIRDRQLKDKQRAWTEYWKCLDN